MPKHSRPRKGSLQYWPRKRAARLLASVNWTPLKNKLEKTGFLGFIAYKAGMISASVKDNTEHSLTKNKKIVLPATILEVPPMKIFSVRFYKQNRVISEIIVSFDKELKKKIKLPKQKNQDLIKKIEEAKDYDDVRVLVYSLVKNTGIKKTPDIIEIALSGNKEDKINLIKNFINKEINIQDIIQNFDKNLIDFRGVSKGYGTQGPVKRFGIKLRFHKSEKGVRKVGSIGPWHPARVTFRVPMAGQTGFFTRIAYNNLILDFGKIEDRKEINLKQGWKGFGKIKSNFIIVKGSIPGPKKRQLLLTPALRPTKKQLKQSYEFIKLE